MPSPVWNGGDKELQARQEKILDEAWANGQDLTEVDMPMPPYPPPMSKNDNSETKRGSIRVSSIDGLDSKQKQYLQASLTNAKEIHPSDFLQALSSRDQAQSTTQYYRKIVLVGLVLLVLALVGMFSTSYTATELAKESFVSERATMTDASGKAVHVAIVESHGLIFDLPSFHVDTLQTIQTLSLYLPRDEVASIDIGTRHKDSTNTVQLRGTDGASSVSVDGCAKLATVIVAGRTHVLLPPTGGANTWSRELAAKKPRLYSSEEIFGELQSFRKNGDGTYRRLSETMETEAKTNFALAVGEERIQKFLFSFNKSFDTLYFAASTFELHDEVVSNEKQFKLWFSLPENEGRLVEIATDGSKKMYDYDFGKIRNTQVTEFDMHGVVTKCQSYAPWHKISQVPLTHIDSLKAMAGSSCGFEILEENEATEFVGMIRLDRVEFNGGPPASLAPVLPYDAQCVRVAYQGTTLPVASQLEQIVGLELHNEEMQARIEGRKPNPFAIRNKAQKNATTGRRMFNIDKFPGTNWCGTTNIGTGGAILTFMEGCCYQHDHGSPEASSHFPCPLDGAALGCFWRNRGYANAHMVDFGQTLMDMGQLLFGGAAGLGHLGGWHCDHWVNTGLIGTHYNDASIRAAGFVVVESSGGGRRLSAPDRSLWGGRRRRNPRRRRAPVRRRRRTRRRIYAWSSVTEAKYSTPGGADPATFGTELTAHGTNGAASTCPTARPSTGNGIGSSGGWRLAPCRKTGNGHFTGSCTAADDNWDSLAIPDAAAPCTSGAVGCCGCIYESCPQSKLTPGAGASAPAAPGAGDVLVNAADSLAAQAEAEWDNWDPWR